MNLKNFEPIILNNLLEKRYLINKYTGEIFDTNKNSLVKRKFNEYNTAIVRLNGRNYNLAKLIANQFIENSNNYKYASLIDKKDSNNYSINNIHWVKSTSAKYNKDYFIKKSIEKFGDRFDFSNLTEINSSNDRIDIVCKKHGILPNHKVLDFINSKYGCPYCEKEIKKNNCIQDLKNIISEHNITNTEDLKKLHPKLYFESEFLGIKIISLIYNQPFENLNDFQNFIDSNNIENPKEFKTKYYAVFDTASRLKLLKNLKYKNRLYIVRNLANKSINQIKSYLDYNNVHTLREFSKLDPSLYSITYRRGIMNNLNLERTSSMMEKEMNIELTKRNIKFEEQKTFSWLINKSHLYYDVYLPDYNTAIELQGVQHFIDNCFNEDLDIIKQRDEIKYNLSISNNVRLVYFISNKTKKFDKIPKEYFELGNYYGPIFTDYDKLFNYIIDNK